MYIYEEKGVWEGKMTEEGLGGGGNEGIGMGVAERIVVGRCDNREREAKSDKWSKKKWGGPVTDTTGRGGQGSGGGVSG